MILLRNITVGLDILLADLCLAALYEAEDLHKGADALIAHRALNSRVKIPSAMKDKPALTNPMSDSFLSSRLTVRQILYGLAIWTVLWTISCSITSAFNHTFSSSTPAFHSPPSTTTPVPDVNMLYKEIERLMAEQKILADEFRLAMREKSAFEGGISEAGLCNETAPAAPSLPSSIINTSTKTVKMPPHDGLTHLKEYDFKDSNGVYFPSPSKLRGRLESYETSFNSGDIAALFEAGCSHHLSHLGTYYDDAKLIPNFQVELIGTSIDHSVKYASAETEPAWNNNLIGSQAGLYIWRIEGFQVISWPSSQAGQFYDGDSYIILHSYEVGEKEGNKRLAHNIFFWLGSKTSQDEAGTAAYKTVELDEYLKGVAVQYREIQAAPSEEFLSLFPRLKILSGGVRSGFHHVDQGREKGEVKTLLRIFKLASGRRDGVVVHEVEPTWQSLDEADVFVLDLGTKIWVWQGGKCSPMEKAKAAQVVNDLTIAKHVDVEVLAQAESRSALVVDLLGGKGVEQRDFHCVRPMGSSESGSGAGRPKRLFRLSDASGQLSFDLVKDGQPIKRADLNGNDVFVLDLGKAIWVWRGVGASTAEKRFWIKVAQMYVNQLQDAYLTPIRSVVEGNENPSFLKALEA
ncbi:Severin [Hyphodiscus hymeniophilus]|uniref:Severin n=1 Tax=Hyphodiscus hymeniophilus TaxID=353542 RepID=A0A9P7AU97_9HELO|nr:Severin [Hyphodiscus hymeniophilus]